MSYGTLKIDTITFTDNSIDKSVSVSGLVQNPSFSGNITATGTISGNIVQGQTISGVTVTGTTAAFTTGTFISLTGTTTEGTTATYTTGSFTSLTGTTTTGTTATFASGVFTTQISGATITGNAAAFTTVTGGTATITSGVFASGTAAAPSVSVGTTDNGIYSPGTDQVAISTNGAGRLFVNSSGNVGVGTSTPVTALQVIGTATFGNGVGGRLQATTDSNLGYIDSLNNTSTQWQPLIQRGTEIQFHTNTAGTTPAQKAVIDSSGRLGLGTSSPGATLHVEGLGNTVNQRIFTSDNVLNATASLTFGTTPGSRSKAAIRMINSNTGNAAGDLSLLTNNGSSGLVSRLYINAAGNVGVGTTDPSTAGAAAYRDLVIANSSNAGITIQCGSGNVAGTVFNTSNGGNAGGYIYQSSISQMLISAGGASGNIAFNANGSERARIDSSGRLLVGTSSTSATGSVFIQGNSGIATGAGYLNLQKGQAAGASIASGSLLGIIQFTDSSSNAFAQIYAEGDGASGSNDYPGRLVFSTTADGASSPTERMRITNDGDIRWADPTTTDNRLVNDGRIVSKGTYNSTTASAANIYMSGSYIFQRSTSSIRYKTNVETLEDSYADAILNCRPVWYKSLCPSDNPDWGHWGFIAEEVAQIDPRLCHYGTDEDGNQQVESVQYDRFVPHLLNLIKRQQQAIETLEAKVAALETQ